MRKLVFLFLSMCVVFSGSLAFAVPGDTCATATVIGSLPYTDANATNCSMTDDANDYSACVAGYDGGYDGFYVYTNSSGAEQYLEFCLTDNATGDWLGLGVFDACPEGGTAGCMGNLGGASVDACGYACMPDGETWYFLVDNWPTPYCADDYTFTLTATTPCPAPPPNDDCAGAIELVGCIEGSTVMAAGDHDCGTGHGGVDLVYYFTLASETQVTILSEADFDMDLTIATTCDATTGDILCSDYNTNIDPSCGSISAVSYGYNTYSAVMPAGTYYIWIDGYGAADAGNFSLELITDAVCTTTCPGGAVAEVEACGVDSNGGCNAEPNVFETIACGDTVCGTAWANGTSRDTDWYQVTLAAESDLNVVGEAEFPLQLYIISGDCTANVLEASAFALACETATATATALPAGTYMIWAGPASYSFDYDCEGNSDYYFTVTCGPLYVDLISFDSRLTKRGVGLKWETAAEIDVLGFDIFRARIRDDGSLGKTVKINDSLIPSTGGSTYGNTYKLLDKDVRSGASYRYFLKAVELSSETRTLGTTDITIKKF